MPQEAINPDEAEITADEYFVSSAKGKIIALEEVPDKTFSQKLLGDGFAIDITDGKIVAPISGKLETVFPSGHAFGIKGPNGVLIHVGIDIVSLDGEGFDVKVKQGDVLVNVDLDKIHQLGKSTLTMVLFTEGNEVTNNDLNKEVTINEQIDVTF